MAEEEKKEEKKIIVDEDWKAEAQREKQILAAQEQAEKKKKARAQRPRGALPKGNFAGLVSMLTSQTLFALGLLQMEGQQQQEPDLEMARYSIDMLETIEQKTKGNLTKEEQKVLADTLGELRMGYVRVADRVQPKSK